MRPVPRCGSHTKIDNKLKSSSELILVVLIIYDPAPRKSNCEIGPGPLKQGLTPLINMYKVHAVFVWTCVTINKLITYRIIARFWKGCTYHSILTRFHFQEPDGSLSSRTDWIFLLIGNISKSRIRYLRWYCFLVRVWKISIFSAWWPSWWKCRDNLFFYVNCCRRRTLQKPQ